jgi:hypothetical protein
MPWSGNCHDVFGQRALSAAESYAYTAGDKDSMIPTAQLPAAWVARCLYAAAGWKASSGWPAIAPRRSPRRLSRRPC